MVDREQTDARRLAEQLTAEQDIRRDQILAALVGVVLVAAISLSGALVALGEFADDLGLLAGAPLAAVIAVPVAVALYALQRARSAHRTQIILRNLTTHDPLTGLPNRRFLGSGFEAIAEQTHRKRSRLATLFVDLEGLRLVNARFGYEVGDVVLVETVRRMRKTLREVDVIVRYSGDAFVVLCPEVTTAKSGEAIAARLLTAISEPIEREDDTFHLSASIGVAVSSEHPERAADVLDDADIALYQARQAGAGAVVLYDESARGLLTPSNAQRRLQDALAKQEFTVAYEPIVSLWTRRLVGVEALLRWDDPSRGMVRPEEFIPLLEETGLIIPVGEWFFEQVLAQSVEWQRRFPGRPAMNIKVNISPRQLTYQHLIVGLRDALERTGATPDNLCIEFAESAMNQDPEVAWDNLRAAKQLGLTLGLDEFGTGYSSLAFLRAFTLDLLKLDQRFIEQIVGSKEDLTIVEHVVALARAMGVATVAYGIQTEQQVELLRSLNCDLGQGPFFSPPQPPTVIEQLLGGDPREDEWRPERGEQQEAPAATAPESAPAAPDEEATSGLDPSGRQS